MKVKEHQVQAAIVDALVAAGFRVKHTSAFRQKGPSGVSKGIPDLLVSHVAMPLLYIGMEVKIPLGKLSEEQRLAVVWNEYRIVRSPHDAVALAISVCRKFPLFRDQHVQRAERVLRSLGGDL